MKLSRKSAIYRMSPSIRQRNRAVEQSQRYAQMVDAAMITLVKALGSSLKPDEYTLIVPDAMKSAAKPWDRLHLADGENNSLICSVSIDPDLAEQVAAFKAELETVNAPKVADSGVPLV